jgi:hypothetical protein
MDPKVKNLIIFLVTRGTFCFCVGNVYHIYTHIARYSSIQPYIRIRNSAPLWWEGPTSYFCWIGYSDSIMACCIVDLSQGAPTTQETRRIWSVGHRYGLDIWNWKSIYWISSRWILLFGFVMLILHDGIWTCFLVEMKMNVLAISRSEDKLVAQGTVAIC